MQTTIGQVLVNEVLPDEFRDYARVLTNKEADGVLEQIARANPEKYRDVSKALMGLGREAAYVEGATLSLSDMVLPVEERADLIKHVREQTRAIMTNDDLSPADKQKALNGVYSKVRKFLVDQTYDRGVGKDNPFALQVLARARGNPSQLAAVMTTPGNYTDAHDNIIPVFIEHSYAEGLSPHEYWAGTYGARRSVISTKFATRAAGYLGKQFNQAAMRLIVTSNDCGTANGIPVDVDDDDNIGAVLGRKAGKYPAGTVISKEVLSDLRDEGLDEIVVRSPLTCGAADGVCKLCTGHREDGKFPKLGAHVGLNGTSALAERMAQGSLNCLADGTLVRMADLSVKKIEELVVGDMVLGADKTGKAFPVRVTATWDQGMQPVNRYEYSIGSTKRRIEVTCTTEHPILVTKKVSAAIYKKYADDDFWSPTSFIPQVLKAGVRGIDVGAVLPTDIESIVTTSEPLAVLCGLLLGDGIRWDSVKFAHTAPKFSCADPSLVDDINVLLAPYGYIVKKSKRSHDYRIASIRNAGCLRDALTGCYSIGGSTHLIKRKLREWGLDNCYAHEKKLPAGVMSWSRSSVVGLLAGYLASDGSVGIGSNGQPFISFGSTSKALLHGIRELLELRLGVYAGSITRTGLAGTGNYVHDMYSLYVTRTDQVRKFGTIVGAVIPGCKRNRFAQVLEALVGKPSSTRDEFVRAIRKQIEPVGMQHCWDITVEHEDSLFVLANGLIVHNTKHCLPLNHTPVRRIDGTVVDISALRTGDKIYGTRNGVITPVSVIALIDQGVQNVHRYSFGVSKRRRGRPVIELLATPDHKVRSAVGVLPVASAETLTIPRSCECGTVNEPLAFFAGFYLGDGIRWSPNADGGELRVSCADKVLVAWFEEYLRPFNLGIRKRTRSYDHAIVMLSDISNQDKFTGRMLPGVRNRAKQLITRLGWKGGYAHTKCIPDEVWTWDRESVAQFVSGFVTADGSVYQNRKQGSWGISFSSCHEDALRDLWRLIVLRLGVRPSALTMIGRAGTGTTRKHDQWQFTVSSRSEFARLARLLKLQGAKLDALATAMTAYRDVRDDNADIVLFKYADEPVGDLACMDITVDSDESLFALASGAIVKNSGGMATDDGDDDYSGFDVIEQFFQAPGAFPHRATVATLDGRIDAITEAPQGGWNILIDGKAHYVLPETAPRVKVGDTVEAGDQLSGGIANPREIVQYKGLGEGRRYFLNRATKAFRDSGYAMNRRNMELLVRGALDHARITDPEGAGDYLPDDVVSYNSIASSYKPRPDAAVMDSKAAIGSYLEQPILHYSIGTRITKNVADQLGRFGHTRVMVHKQPPPFEPYMVSLREVPQHEKDWMAQLGSSYLKSNLMRNAHIGATSEIHSTHPGPAIARGVELGEGPKGQIGY